MDCPVCKTVNLVMSERQGIEIDYCPQCRGVWLDRGELDKIIDRAAPAQPAQPAYTEPSRSRDRERDERHYKKKKRGFLGDIFDFD